MNSVVIGDCVATAVNVLLPEITGATDCVVDMVDAKKKLDKDLFVWFLKNNKTKMQFSDIRAVSHKYKLQREKELAWPSHIDNCINLAVTGETFQGMHNKIKDHVAEKGKPGLVLITDFSESHRCVVVHSDGKQYVVKRDLNLLDADQGTWPQDVYEKFVAKVKQQELFGQRYQKRKHKKSFDMLIRFLESNDISYKFLLFRKDNEYITRKYEDMTEYNNSYLDAAGREISSKKLLAQEHIASHVKNTFIAQ